MDWKQNQKLDEIKIRLLKMSEVKGSGEMLLEEHKDDWEDYKKSDNFHNGIDANPGSCPCEDFWWLNFEIKTFDHEPSPDEIKELAETVTEPGPPPHECTGTCVWRMIGEGWHDWFIEKHKTKEEYTLHCDWNKQWHCEKDITDIPTYIPT